MTLPLPVQSQITPATEPEVRWGVHFLRENRVSDYGPGDAAKAAAEETVLHWAETPYPAALVSQVILPWSTGEDTRIALTIEILNALSDVKATVILRKWLVEKGYDEEPTRKTGLAVQVPLVKRMRRAHGISVGYGLLQEWLRDYGYEKA